MQRVRGEVELKTVYVHGTQEEERLVGEQSLKDFVSHPREFVLFSPKQFPKGSPVRGNLII